MICFKLWFRMDMEITLVHRNVAYNMMQILELISHCCMLFVLYYKLINLDML